MFYLILDTAVVLSAFALGAWAMWFFSKEKKSTRLPSFQSVKEASQPQPLPSNQSTSRDDPAAYLIRHYRNGNGSDAYVICRRVSTDYDAKILEADPYHELEVWDYNDADLPDFGGFGFFYINEDEDDPERNVVGFTTEQDAISVLNSILETYKEQTWHLIED